MKNLPSEILLKIISLGKRDLRVKLQIKPGKLNFDEGFVEHLNTINRFKLVRKRAFVTPQFSPLLNLVCAKGHAYVKLTEITGETSVCVFKPSNCLVRVFKLHQI